MICYEWVLDWMFDMIKNFGFLKDLGKEIVWFNMKLNWNEYFVEIKIICNVL